MIHLEVDVLNSAELLATPAYGAGALLRWESAALVGGPFVEGDTIPLTAATSYDIWDPAGVVGTWYRTRVSNAGATTFSAYGASTQGGMRPRPGMASIIARLRRDIGDVGPTQDFEDEELQDFLDERSVDVSNAPLTADIMLSGSPTVFRHAASWWESTAVVSSSSGVPITADGGATSPLQGVWAFASAPGAGMYVTGRYFDYWGAAANACEARAARVATQFDFVTDGQAFNRSQKREGLLAVAREYGRRAFVRS